MFYNVDILTHKKSGLGVVWLAATLGNRNVFHKLSRKEVTNVKIDQACQRIIAPEEPMALRLSSQLMHGIVRVYVQQTELWMTDVTNVHAAVRRILLGATPGSRQAASTAVDLPVTARVARKDAITLPEDPTRLFPQYYGIFDRDPMSMWDVGSVADIYQDDIEPDRASTPASFISTRHTVDLARITLPSAQRPILEEPFAADETGAGVGLGYDYAEDQTFDLGIGDELGLPAPMETEPPLLVQLPRDETAGSADFRRRRGVVSSSDIMGPPGAFDYDMPPQEEEMRDIFAGLPIGAGEDLSSSFQGAQRTLSQIQQEEDMAALEASLNSGEREVLGIATARFGHPGAHPRGAKRKRVSFAQEDERLELTDSEMREIRDAYGSRMQELNRAAQVKAAEQEAEKVAKALLDATPELFAGGALESMWKETVQATEIHIINDAVTLRKNLAALTPEERRKRQDQDRGIPPPATTAPEAPPTFGPAEGQDQMFEEEMHDIFAGVPIERVPGDISSSNEVARGARSGSVAVSERVSDRLKMPWNVQDSMLHVHDNQTGRQQSLSMSDAPEMSRRLLRRDSSITQLSAGRESVGVRDRDSLLGEGPRGEGLAIDDEETLALAAGASASQIYLSELQKESDNFLRYTRLVEMELPAGQALFFSDIVPVVSSTPAIAAQGFYHLLSLATNRRIKVEQREANSEIEIALL